MEAAREAERLQSRPRPRELLRSQLAPLQHRQQRPVTSCANRKQRRERAVSGPAVITPNEDGPTLFSGVIFGSGEHSGVFIMQRAVMRDAETETDRRQRIGCLGRRVEG